MIADLDESIRQLLIQQGNLNSGEVDIAFDMPTREWSSGVSKPTVNVYLFDVRENRELKVTDPWQVRRGGNNTAIKSRPAVRIDLTYRITTYANAVEDEHRLLSRVLLVLFQHPTLPEEVLQGAIVGQAIATFAASPQGLIQAPADFWGALDNDIRPSVDYRLNMTLDLAQEIEVGLALTSQIKIGEIDPDDGLFNIEELGLRIGGRVHEEGDPEKTIGGAQVTLLERALDTVTDAEGRYTFSGVPAGKYTIVILAPGMDERREELEVPAGSYDIGI